MRPSVSRAAAIVTLAGAGLVVGAESAQAQGFDLSGAVAAELRPFLQAPRFERQLSGLQSSLAAAPELHYRSADRSHQFKLAPFARLDSRDSERAHVDLREAWWRTVHGDWELLVGFNRVFWGVTESRHLVDVINQVDLVEDVDEEDRLGQAMINVGWQRPWGRLDAFVLLGFRERTLPGPEGRPGLPLPAIGDPLFVDGPRDVDVALRYAHYFGDFDLGLHLFHGTGREPAFTVGFGSRPDSVELLLVPVYRTVTQAGIDLQYTRDAWLWKLEAIVREGEGSTFGALVGGFEYTLYQLGGGASDLGLLVEYLRDGRDQAAPVTLFDDDLFVGSRLALNDTQDTAVLAGAVIDLADGSTAARVEADRRLHEHLHVALEARLFVGVNDANALVVAGRDSFLNLRLAWSF